MNLFIFSKHFILIMVMVEQHWAKGRNTPWMGKRVQFIVASQHICMVLDGGIKPENTEVIIRNFFSLIFIETCSNNCI